MALPVSRSRKINQPAPHRFTAAPAATHPVRRIVLLYLLFLAVAAFAGGLLPPPPGLPAALASILRTTPSLSGPPLGAVCGSLLIALLALVPSIVIPPRQNATVRPQPSNRLRRSFGAIDFAGRRPQGLTIFGLAVMAGYAAWHLGLGHADAVREPARRLATGGTLIAAAFPLLVVERFFVRMPPAERAPNVDLLYVPVVMLPACGMLEAAAGMGIGRSAVAWLETLQLIYTFAVAAELAVRMLPVLFAPRGSTKVASVAGHSLLAKLLRPRALTATAISSTVKQRFGLDFSRSWAVTFIRGAAIPVLLSSAVFCWFLSAVVSVGLNQRGQYERFGVPDRIFQSGLHLVLPWPFGMVRRVEHGVIHSVTIGDTESTLAAAPGEFVPTAAAGPVGAEDIPPASTNRLWDQPRQSEVSYVIASTSANRQSFETISADLRVLFRIGLDDESVRRAAYRTSDPPALVRTLAREQLAQFFATRTLACVLGTDREAIAHQLQQQLAASLGRLRTGIEIVAVIVEAAQPPSGAAAAYHHVQAAQIDATTEISTERGRAAAAGSVATRDAHDLLNKANGSAAEAIAAAQIDLAYFQADDVAYRAGGHAFILERYFTNLQAALGRTVLEILDDRLDGGDLPTLDLRPPRAADDMPQRNPRQ